MIDKQKLLEWMKKENSQLFIQACKYNIRLIYEIEKGTFDAEAEKG